tara:strand:- start:1942 stop:3870 length:1929 start_codon:yes stop_codon:yes gene_type:complete
MDLDEAYTDFLTNQVAPPPAPPVPEPVAAPEPAATPEPKPGEFYKGMPLMDALGIVARTAVDLPDAAVRGAAKGLGETIYAAGLIDDKQITSYRDFWKDMDKLHYASGVNPTVTGLAEDVGQILPAAVPAFKIFRGLGMVRPAAALLAEGIGGAVGYNPDDPNLGNVISGMIGDDKQGVFSQAMRMLATNPEDPDVINRARNFAQDAGIGGMFEGVFKAIQKSPDAGRAALQWFNDTVEGAQQGTMFSGIPTRPDAPAGALMEPTSSPVINDLSPGAVPEFEGSPSITFRAQELPTPIEGVKGPGKVSPGDIGRYWDADYLARYGRQGDPNNPQDLDRAINQATAEAKFQLRGIESGKGWYDKDIAETWDASGEVFPELSQGLTMMPNPASSKFANGEEVSAEALRILTTAIASPLSFGNRPKPNFNTALKVLDGWLNTGRIPDMNPQTGKLWTMRNVSSQSLRLLQYMIDTKGVEGTAEWLMSPHTVRELRDMKRAANIWKDSPSMSIPGKLDDTKLGAFILGRKGGPFFLNLNGIEDTTADLWFTRTWNRQFGRMTSPNLPANEEILNQPRAIERGAMREWNQEVAGKLGETEQDSQAILWYYEQQLFNAMGQKSAKPSKFSDGAKLFRDEGGRGRFGIK